MAKEPKSSTAKAKAQARRAGTGESYEGGKHRPKEKASKNQDRARRR
jgi:hypothetical protein